MLTVVVRSEEVLMRYDDGDDNDMIRKLITHIESEALGRGSLAAEGRLEKSSFKFSLDDIARLKTIKPNGIWKLIPDLGASCAEATGRDDRYGAGLI
jgi:hypothetical protein